MDIVKFPERFDVVSDVGSVDRRGLGGLGLDVSGSIVSDVFGGSSRHSGEGEDMSAGGGSVRGTIFVNILVAREDFGSRRLVLSPTPRLTDVRSAQVS